MKVYVYPADLYGCGHYRMIFPAQELQRRGYDVTIIDPGERTGIGGIAHSGDLTRVFAPSDADVIVLQRPANIMLSQAVHLLRAAGIAVVVDMDDDLNHIHPSNPAFRGMHPRHSPKDNWVHVARACRDATLVTVSTPTLVPVYAPHERFAILENLVPRRYLDVPVSDDEEPIVGWAGSLHSHPNDLNDATGALQRLVREDVHVRFVGSHEGVERKLGASVDATGVIEFDDWPARVAELGIGIAPLADTRFNQSKSWLKPLEYSALGVPWIASPSREYVELAKLCEGSIVRKPRDWYREMRKLVDDPGLRRHRSQAAREVAAQLTYEEHADLWIEAWTAAYEFERRSAPPRVTH